MYFPDLDTACQMDKGPNVRAIGWLDNQHPFPKGPVSEPFLNALRQHIQQAWQSVAAAGWHDCELCKSNPACNGNNVWIPTETLLYVAPAMITHYIEAHNYQPPAEFIEAVLTCPPQKTPEYYELVKRHSLHAEWAKSDP